MDFITRYYNPTTDKDFVYNSYLTSFRKNSPIMYCPPTLYFPNQAKVLDSIVEGAEILLAVFPEDANEIMGYLIYRWVNENLVIHYAYTKYAFRRKGLALSLIKQVMGERKPFVVCTHWVNDSVALRHKQRFVYDPYLLRRSA